jgi:hypothetical protein
MRSSEPLPAHRRDRIPAMTAATLDIEFPGLTAALAGQYQIERELGRGGTGIVLLARDVKLDRAVALKVLPPALATNATTRERFLREARTAAQLSHPNIVPIHRADELGGYAFFAMGFVDGETVAQRLDARGPFPAADVVRLLRDTAWALAYAHARGVVHRDVKPENIMLERGTDRVVVTDFGIAQGAEASRLTATGNVLGSVHFMSPEQGAGEVLDGRSDLYALGAVGFLLLSGRLPFEHESAAAVLVQRATRDAPSLRTVAPEVPRALADVIDRCLARDREQRYATGEAMAEALVQALAAAMTAPAGGGLQVLDDAQAAAVWRRAAQLQADAAARLEARTREAASLPSSTAARSPITAETPEGGYRQADVEQAAAEAGISRQYVAVALAELQSSGGVVADVNDGSDTTAKIVLGVDRPEVSITRRIAQPPRAVLAAMGKALQAAPARLTLEDTLGGHALQGGVLVFKIPPIDGTEGVTYHWTWTRYQTWSEQLRAQLSAVPGDSSQCDVTLSVDLRPGRRAAMWEGVGFGGFGSFIGGIGGKIAIKIAAKHAGWAIVTAAKAAFVAAGVTATAPLLVSGGIAVGLAAGFLSNRFLYQHAFAAVYKELNATVDLIEREFRTAKMFSDPFGDPSLPASATPPLIAPPTPSPRRRG